MYRFPVTAAIAFLATDEVYEIILRDGLHKVVALDEVTAVADHIYRILTIRKSDFSEFCPGLF